MVEMARCSLACSEGSEGEGLAQEEFKRRGKGEMHGRDVREGWRGGWRCEVCARFLVVPPLAVHGLMCLEGTDALLLASIALIMNCIMSESL